MKQFNFDITVATNALLCPNPETWYDKAYLDAVDPNNYNVIPGVKNSTKLAYTRFPSVLQALDCTFAATANPLSATTVTVCPLKANVSICKKTLESSFVAKEMKAGSQNYTVESFMAHYWNVLQEEIAQEVGYIMWQGNVAGTGSTYTGEFAFKTLCDGFEKLLNANAAVTKLIGSAVTTSSNITPSNVISAMTAVIAAAPTAIKAKKDAIIYAASNVVFAYRVASSLGNTAAFITGEMPLSFVGYRIVEVPFMSDNEILFTRPMNMIYALDGSEDASNLVSIDQLKTIGVPNILTTVLLTIGFQIVNPEEIVFLKPF